MPIQRSWLVFLTIQTLILLAHMSPSKSQPACFTEIQSASTAVELLDNVVVCLQSGIGLGDIRRELKEKSGVLVRDTVRLAAFVSQIPGECIKTSKMQGSIERVTFICDVIRDGIKPHIFALGVEYQSGQPTKIGFDITDEPI